LGLPLATKDNQLAKVARGLGLTVLK
jgi:hypothetical protein